MLLEALQHKNVVSNGLVLDKNGNKMSKRLGNAVDPFTTIDQHGADATRWYMISNAKTMDKIDPVSSNIKNLLKNHNSRFKRVSLSSMVN